VLKLSLASLLGTAEGREAEAGHGRGSEDRRDDPVNGHDEGAHAERGPGIAADRGERPVEDLAHTDRAQRDDPRLGGGRPPVGGHPVGTGLLPVRLPVGTLLPVAAGGLAEGARLAVAARLAPAGGLAEGPRLAAATG